MTEDEVKPHQIPKRSRVGLMLVCNFCSSETNVSGTDLKHEVTILQTQGFPNLSSTFSSIRDLKEKERLIKNSVHRGLNQLVWVCMFLLFLCAFSPALPHSPQSWIICDYKPAVSVSVSLSVHSGSSFHSQWLNCCFLSEQTRKQSLCDSKIKAVAGIRPAWNEGRNYFPEALSWKKLALFIKCHPSCKKAVTLLTGDFS